MSPTAQELIVELRGNECRCGSRKTRRQTFCKECYYRLPKAKKSALYNNIGFGYEAAYDSAAQHLDAHPKPEKAES